MKTSVRSITADPEALADIKKRREAGEAMASIGKSYGVSRERIRQICDRLGVRAPEKESPALKAVELIKANAVSNLLEAAKQGGCGVSALKGELQRQGFDLEQVKAELFTHRYDGRSWGDWTAINGGYVYENHDRRWVKCRCVCGTERLVSLNNLTNKMTLSCGCRSTTDGRRRVPWVCAETGERFENTSALAKHLGINHLLLYRRLRRGDHHIDAQGRQWKALPEEATLHRPDEGHLEKLNAVNSRPVVCVDTGETWISAAAAASSLGIHSQTLRDALRRNGHYCIEGLTYKRVEEVTA